MSTRVACDNCKGLFVECTHQVIDLKSLDVFYYCTPACLKRALINELEPFGKEK